MSRRTISHETIEALIRAQMSLIPDCKDCFCGRVVWQHPDGEGCNWIVSQLDGVTAIGCIDHLAPLLGNLRENFNIAEPFWRPAEARGSDRVA